MASARPAWPAGKARAAWIVAALRRCGAAAGQEAAGRRDIASGREILDETHAGQPYVVETDGGNWLRVLTAGKGVEGKPGQHIAAPISSGQSRTGPPLVDIEPADGPEASRGMPLKTRFGRVHVFYTCNRDNLRADMVQEAFLFSDAPDGHRPGELRPGEGAVFPGSGKTDRPQPHRAGSGQGPRGDVSGRQARIARSERPDLGADQGCRKRKSGAGRTGTLGDLRICQRYLRTPEAVRHWRAGM